MSKDTAKNHHLSLGSRVPASFVDTGPAVLEVAAIYNNADLVGDFFLSRQGFDAHFASRLDNEVFVARRASPS